MNKWTGIGRLTRDSEIIYTPSGVAITTFTIAVDRRFKNAQGERETDFITVKAFKQLAELCANYLSKGNLAGVSGELQIRTYNDKDGNKRWVSEIVADEVQFLSPKDSGGSGQAQSPPPAQQQRQSSPPGSMPPPPGYQGAPRADGPPNGQGQPPGYSYGREVNLDDDIPF